MEPQKELFADGIGEITLSNGVVRMDFVSIVGAQKSKDQPQEMAVRQRVIMPPDGFLRSFSAMENLVKQLIDAGLVKPRNGENPDNQASAAAAKSGDAPKSPNF